MDELTRQDISANVVLLKISQLYDSGMSAEELYEATRQAWHASGERLAQADYAFSVYKNEIVEVYAIESWSPVTIDDPDVKVKDRWKFDGYVAADMQHYVGKSVKPIYGASANPVAYTYSLS